MANKYDDADGVWRTIGGRRVFIRTGQSLSDAMKESGKFNTKKKDDNKKEDAITKKTNDEWKAQAQKMEKNYEEFGSNTVDDEKRLNELSRERDIAQSKLTPKEVQDANKDGKYYRDRLLELDSADTPTGTYDIETGEVANFNGKGYNVSFEQTGVQLSDEEYLAKINECRERCDGKVYFGKYGGTPEASFYTEDINEALKIMKENNQKSIYDIANDTEIFNDEYNEATNKIKDLSQTKATNDDIGNQIKQSIHNANLGEETKKLKDRKITTSQLEDYKKEYDEVQKQIDKNWNIISEEASKGANKNVERLEKAKKEFDDLGARKNELGSIINLHTIDDSENKTMNDLIREKASKKSTFKDDLPKHTEIKTQGTSNRKEVSENIQAYILDHYTSDYTGEDISPQEAFIRQMDAFDNMPTKWHAGQEMAKQGFYDIYYDDQRKFLDDLKINPKGKEFSDDRVFQTYSSLIGRESAKLYDRLQKNEYNKYKQSHPLTKMTLEEFIKSRKER